MMQPETILRKLASKEISKEALLESRSFMGGFHDPQTGERILYFLTNDGPKELTVEKEQFDLLVGLGRVMSRNDFAQRFTPGTQIPGTMKIQHIIIQKNRRT